MKKLVIAFLLGVALTLAATQPAKAGWLSRLVGIEQPQPNPGCPPPPTAKR